MQITYLFINLFYSREKHTTNFQPLKKNKSTQDSLSSQFLCQWSVLELTFLINMVSKCYYPRILKHYENSARWYFITVPTRQVEILNTFC